MNIIVVVIGLIAFAILMVLSYLCPTPSFPNIPVVPVCPKLIEPLEQEKLESIVLNTRRDYGDTDELWDIIELLASEIDRLHAKGIR